MTLSSPRQQPVDDGMHVDAGSQQLAPWSGWPDPKRGLPCWLVSPCFSVPASRFQDLSEREVLALAISSEEEDGRIYSAYAAKLRGEYPASAAIFDGMAAEEDEHRRRLIEAYRHRFGEFVVPLRREHVADFFTRRPVWLIENLGLDRIRQEAVDMERQARDLASRRQIISLGFNPALRA